MAFFKAANNTKDIINNIIFSFVNDLETPVVINAIKKETACKAVSKEMSKINLKNKNNEFLAVSPFPSINIDGVKFFL